MILSQLVPPTASFSSLKTELERIKTEKEQVCDLLQILITPITYFTLRHILLWYVLVAEQRSREDGGAGQSAGPEGRPGAAAQRAHRGKGPTHGAPSCQNQTCIC